MLFLFIFAFCNRNAAENESKKENEKQAKSRNYVIGIGKIVPENDIIQLVSPVPGIVQKIYKKENDSVAVGTIILELEHDLEDEKIIQLRTQVATQAAQINVDKATVNQLDAEISNAKTELQRLQNLATLGAETQQTVDNAASKVKSYAAQLNGLQATISVSTSKWREAKANLKTAQLERDQKIIRSPINGRILEISVLIGGSVSIQQSFVQISPNGRIIAIAEIDELNATKIEVGQRGWIRSVGSADTLSTGRIYFAATFLKKKSLFTDQSGEKEDRRVRTLKMVLDNSQKLLLNARVECVIDVSTHSKK